MKNLTQSLGSVVFSLSAFSMLSAIELLNLSPALAATEQYYGKDADVSVRCDTVGKQSYGNFTINGTKTNTYMVGVAGSVYFNENISTSQVIAIARSPTKTFDGDGYFHTGYAQKFSVALVAVGGTPNNPVISLPDLSKFPSKDLGYDVKCPYISADGYTFQILNLTQEEIIDIINKGRGIGLVQLDRTKYPESEYPTTPDRTWLLYFDDI
jgi:hypothetical protein